MDVLRAAAAMAMLSGMAAYPRRATAAGPEDTPEMKAKRQADREASLRASEQRRLAREDVKAQWQAVYNPQYVTEPQREDFPSRQTFRAAHRKWSAKEPTP